MLRRFARRVLPITAALALSAGALAQDEKPKPDNAPTSFTGPVLVFDHVALDQIFVDPRDKSLSNAISMLPARLRELPRELPNMPPEAAELINMAVAAIARPGRVAIAYSDAPSGGAFGYGVTFSVLTNDQAEADQMHGRISGLIAKANAGNKLPSKPSKRFKGMTDIQTPAAVLTYGPRQAKDGWRYEVMFGTVDNPDSYADALPRPAKDFTPVFRGRLDLAGLLPALDLAENFAAKNPDAMAQIQDAREQLGEHPVRVSFESGFTPTSSLSIVRVENAQRPKVEPITSADLALIPADANEVYFAKTDGHALSNIIDRFSEKLPPVAEALDQFHDTTGVDLQKDLLGSLGGTVALYLSDSTGGGSLTSSVFMIDLKDRQRFASALNKLAGMANQLADSLPLGPGYIRLTNWAPDKQAGADFMSLRFPGLPVPLELSLAMTDRWLIMAPTPQAAIAAVRQATGKGDAGLTANKVFAAHFKTDHKLMALTFSDTSRNLREGYSYLSFLGSAIANAVRSPSDPSREPGLVIPLYNDLNHEVRPAVGITYWDGDVLVTEHRADRSILVQAGGAFGLFGKVAQALPAFALPGAAMGGIGGAMQEAQRHRHNAPPPAPKQRRPRSGATTTMLPSDPTTASAVMLLTVAEEAIPELQLERTLWSLASENTSAH